MDEKRKHKRFVTHRATEIKSDGDRTRLGVTQDISRSGTRLLTRIALDIGKEVDLKITFDNFEETAWWPALVVRIHDLPDAHQLWRKEVSFEFNAVLPENMESTFSEE